MTDLGGDPGDLSYRCGRCGYEFTAQTEGEWRKLYGQHRGGYCLAIINPMTSDQVSFLMNDIGRLMKPKDTIGDLMLCLGAIAKHKAVHTDSPEEGASGESDE